MKRYRHLWFRFERNPFFCFVRDGCGVNEKTLTDNIVGN
jgi:hypothetical protein